MSVALAGAMTPQNRLIRLLETALSASSSGTVPAGGSSADASLVNALREAHALAAALDPYVERCTSHLLIPSRWNVEAVRETLNDLLKATEETDWKAIHESGKTQYRLNKGMCSGEYEAVVLQHLVTERARPTRVLEIGLFTGTTTLALALLDNVTSVVALDIEPFLETFDRPYWDRAGVSDKITTLFGPATTTLEQLSRKRDQFDVIYIDADKPNYKTYVSLLLELDLLAEDGTIYADNTLYKGFVCAAPATAKGTDESELEGLVSIGSNNRSLDEATQGISESVPFRYYIFNDWVRKDGRLTCAMLPLRDGLTIIKRAASFGVVRE